MLQQHDVNELLTTLLASQETNSARGGGGGFAEVKIYDFARPDNVPSEFLHALEPINYNFSRNFASLLTSYLSIGVQVDPLSIDQLTFRQYCNSVPDISAVCTFGLAPLEGFGLFELNSPLAWFLIDKGLGGPGEIVEKPRPFTTLARGLIDDLMKRILRELVRAWEPMLALQPKIREVLNDPSQARICQPEDSLLVSTFNIAFPKITGLCTFCVPVYSLDFEMLLKQDTNDGGDARLNDPDYMYAVIVEHLAVSPVQVRACLPDIAISLDELTALQEGDIIPFTARADGLIELRVSNQRSYLGRPVTIDDQVAIEIDQEWSEDYCE